MKKLLLVALPAASLLLNSCYFDPNATNVGYGTSYSSGGGYSSSLFVSTGDPRWAYDPGRYCYYDRYRRSYYDPYLYGYYPTGYVPVAVRGCPHPYGWSGSGYCPVPRSINTRTLGRYDQRLSNYAAADYHWARRVSASGNGQWLGSNEREVLHTRSYAKDQPSKVDGWMGGSGGVGNSGSNMRQSYSAPQFNSQSSRSIAPQEPTLIRQAQPEIQPRNTNGGIFGGLDRSSRSSLGGVREQPQPRVEIQREQPQIEERVEREEESSGFRGGLDRDDSSGGSGGAGLRGFR